MNIQIGESSISDANKSIKQDDINHFDIPIGTTIFTPKSNNFLMTP